MSETIQILKDVWWYGIIENVQNKLSGDYNFYISDKEALASTKIPSLLKHLHLRMVDQLRSIVDASVGRFTGLLKTHSVDSIEFTRPLAELHVTVKDSKVALVPSFERTCQYVDNIFAHVISGVKGFNTIDATVLSLLYLDEVPIVDCEHNPCAQDIIDIIQIGREKAKNIIDRDYSAAKNAVAGFNDLIRVCTCTPDEYMKSLPDIAAAAALDKKNTHRNPK